MEVKFPAWAEAQFARAAPTAGKFRDPIGGSIRLTVVCAVLLSIIVASGCAIFLYNVHNRIRTINERSLAGNASVLAKQFE
jgi:hypothetical protein